MPEIEQRRQIDGDSSARIDCILPPPLPREGKEQEAKPMPHSLLAKAMVDAAFTEDPNWAKYQPKILKKALEKGLRGGKAGSQGGARCGKRQ